MRETKKGEGAAGTKGCVRGNEETAVQVKPFACATRAIEELKGARLKGCGRRRRRRERGTTRSEGRSDFISRRLDPRGNLPAIN